MSFGYDRAWDAKANGVPIEELFERSCFLSDLLKKEEVLKDRITKSARAFFEKTLAYMAERKIVARLPNGNVAFKSS